MAALLRDPLNQARAAYLPIAAFLVARGRTGEALVVACLLLATMLPPVLSVPRPFEAAFVVAISLQAGGGVLGLFGPDFGYDILVHTALTGAAAACAYLALVAHRVLPDPAQPGGAGHDLGVTLVVAAIGMSLGTFWEITEAVADELFATSLVRSPLDTSVDLVANGIGALIGGAAVSAWARGRREAAGAGVDREPAGAREG